MPRVAGHTERGEVGDVFPPRGARPRAAGSRRSAVDERGEVEDVFPPRGADAPRPSDQESGAASERCCKSCPDRTGQISRYPSASRRRPPKCRGPRVGSPSQVATCLSGGSSRDRPGEKPRPLARTTGVAVPRLRGTLVVRRPDAREACREGVCGVGWLGPPSVLSQKRLVGKPDQVNHKPMIHEMIA